MTNPTPDTALAARLIELSVKSTQDPLNEDGRYFNGDWHNDLTQCSHGDTGNYSNRRDGQFIAALWNAFRDGQIITLAEHEAIIATRTPTPAPNAGAVKVTEEQNTEQRKVFWNWLPLAYRDGHIGEEPKFSKYNMEVAHYAGWAAAIETTPDPRDEVIARMVEAAEKLASWDHCWPGNINLEWEIGKLRAAIAAAKEVMK